MIYRFLFSIFIISTISILWAESNTSLNEKGIDKIIDLEDKALIDQIEQQIIKERYDLAQKELQQKKEKELQQIKASEIDMQKLAKINSLKDRIQQIEAELKDNILLKRYSNYSSYTKISTQLAKLKAQLKNNQNQLDEEKLFRLHNKIKVKQNELELIKEYKGSPIGALINPPEIKSFEEISNPFGIINALSHIQELKENKKQFKQLEDRLTSLVKKLDEELVLYLDLFNLLENSEYKDKITFLDKQKKDFSMVLEIVSTTQVVYTRKIEQIILDLEGQISEQIQKVLVILSIILTLSFLTFLIKLTLKKYFSQNESFYMINKIINFTVVFLIVMTVLFSYIDNVSYLVTILGFASAGIAIALKDWFMSIFGWMVIVTSGSIQVGDRIKVNRNNLEVVGDVLDISLFKITIREDITYTSYKVNRRTGRIFFIPNNYIFSEMIANYTHSGLRTVWDGIDMTITYDSNHKKAQKIMKDILKHYSKGYTDITRKQLSKMRSKYQLRSTGVEPRVFTFVEEYGMVISGWYLTNSYAALQLRSTMSPEIVNAFMKEDDIHIAFPTQQININKTDNAYGVSVKQKNKQRELEDEIISR
ncbi:MAG: mechanosensitive ion channel domain-containing protein [Campylobacterota bacterium]